MSCLRAFSKSVNITSLITSTLFVSDVFESNLTELRLAGCFETSRQLCVCLSLLRNSENKFQSKWLFFNYSISQTTEKKSTCNHVIWEMIIYVISFSKQEELKWPGYSGSTVKTCCLSLPYVTVTSCLTWCSRSCRGSCLLYCSRCCCTRPAGRGSTSTWGIACANTAP